jgi:photosystem II stability/assembly factor-like uncharacterized protein
MKRIVFFTFFFLPLCASAQWTQIPSQKFEAIKSAGHTLWGYSPTIIFVSEDYGNSWRPALPGTGAVSKIYHLTVIDENSAIATYQSNSVIGFDYTTDRGLNWTNIPPLASEPPTLLNISANNTDLGNENTMFFGKKTGSICYYSLTGGIKRLHKSTDLGVTWSSVDAPTTPDLFSVAFSPTGDMYGITGNDVNGVAKVFHSTDEGATWLEQSQAQNAYEPWSFVIDSCDNRSLYVYGNDRPANGGNFQNEGCDVLFSPNEGKDWKTTLSYEFREYDPSFGVTYDSAGDCLAVSPNAVYAAHYAGIHRSADHGCSWQNIGGPHVVDEVQGIAALDDTIIFALDDGKQLWRTVNAGGFPITPTPLSFTPDTVFKGDTLFGCGDRISRLVVAQGSSCPTQHLISQSITGIGAEHYSIADSMPSDIFCGDTARIEFFVNGYMPMNAAYELHFSDGSAKIIPLNGNYTVGVGVMRAMLSSANATQDTIGADVRIPIILSHSPDITSADISVHFDTSLVEYVHSVDMNGNAVDLFIDLAHGSSRLAFSSGKLAAAGDTIGYAIFHSYIGNGGCTNVRFDSLSIISNLQIVCAVDTNSSALATICAAAGCGNDIIAHYLRYGKVNAFSLSPNPTSGKFTITFSRPSENTTVEIYDILGNLRSSTVPVETGAKEINIDASHLPAGIYFVRVTTKALRATLPVEIIK